ncbi:MAG TPA: Holliday junction branch migration protein RuvA, partial [Aquirhabdus sp.]
AMLIQSIEMQDITTLTRIPGVGKKTAERLVIELRDRLQVFAGSQTTVAGHSQITLSAASPIAEAEAALVSLGYKPVEAQRAVTAIKNDHSDTANLIRAALKGMLKN